jgi:hypothetical protein
MLLSDTEIAALAKVEISTARAYLQGLLRAGYVAVESTRPLGDSRRKEELLRLVRDCARELGLGHEAGLIPALRDPKDLFGELAAAPAIARLQAA